MTDDEQTGALETPADAGKGPAGVVHRWLLEWNLASKVEEDWRKRAKSAVERYRDEKDGKAETGGSPRFNIFHSNVQTIMPSLYGKTPAPDIRRRYRDRDPVGRQASEVLERAVEFLLDDGSFDEAMMAAVFDRCTVGRAVTRVRYVPQFNTDDDALTDQIIEWEPIPWEDFRRGPGRRWQDVTWIGFRHWLTVEDGVERFGPDFKDIEADAHPEAVEEDGPDNDTFKRVEVWEIWDKLKREVIYIAPKNKHGPLKTVPDPLNLKGFFPIPKPLYAIPDSGSLLPVEEFRIYRDQAAELDTLTARITRIVEVLKVRGVADSRIAELWNTENMEDGEFAAASDVTQYLQGGGLENAIWIMPIDKIIAVLRVLYESREAVKQTIYEITGISDILRGASKQAETATAQSIKAQWGSIRMQRAQRDVQRYARDLIRIGAEIIGEQFEVETLAKMTGVQLPTEQDLAAMAQMAMQQGDDPRELMQEPTWEKVRAVLSDDLLRAYRIDIETDSTIEADEQADKDSRIELSTALMGSLTQGLQIAAAAPELAPLVKDTLLFVIRGFKDSRALEASIEESMDKGIEALEQSQQQQGADPTQELKVQQEQIKAQTAQVKAQADVAKANATIAQSRIDQQHAGHEHQYDMQKMAGEIQKLMLEIQNLSQEMQMDRERHAMKMQEAQASAAMSGMM